MNLDFLEMTKEKQKVLAIHVVLSLFIFIVLLAGIKYFWFPGNLINIDGGWTVIQIIAVVSIVFGPILTLFFVDPDRASFKKNALTIITVQILALITTMWTLADQRDAVIVFSGTKFHTITSGALKEATAKLTTLNKKPTAYRSNEHNVLKMAYVTHTCAEKNAVNKPLKRAVSPDLFNALKDNWPAIKKHKITNPKILANIRSHSLMSGKELFKFNADIYHLQGRYKEAFIIFDSSTNKVIDIIIDKQIKQ